MRQRDKTKSVVTEATTTDAALRLDAPEALLTTVSDEFEGAADPAVAVVPVAGDAVVATIVVPVVAVVAVVAVVPVVVI